MSEPLRGGNSNQVMREGDTVVRQTGPWSPFVQHVLRHLADHGFAASPVLIETTEHTERLTFLKGEVGNDPLKPYMQSPTILIEAAQLLRRLHDITQQVIVPDDAVFMLPVPPDQPREVICHNDFAPYNCVFREGHLVGIIDFDTAGPGSRLWDIAYAVYRFVPLMNDDHCRDAGWESIPDRVARLRLFCEAYGLDDRMARAALVDTVIARLAALIAYMRETGLAPEHIPIYEQDIDYMRAQQGIFTAGLLADAAGCESMPE
ncbi:MAG: phosphotransferase [Anaerolineae bacterium]|nr:phosphotransferase [Anaerolineae bacterium]